MPYEIKKDIKPDLSDLIIRSGNSAQFEFSGQGLDKGAHHRLYFTCENRMHYIFKDEPMGDKLYMLIEDSLDTEHAEYDRYCLDLSEKMPRPFTKSAIKKLMWPPMRGIFTVDEATDIWTVGIFARADGLVIHEGGFIRICYERWALKDGVNPHETGREPDETEYIYIEEGSYPYTDFSKAVSVPDDTACVLITIEAENYSGEIYLERPYFRASGGDNVLPAFDIILPAEKVIYRDFGWIGMNLSKKEWPRFRIELSGKVIFEDEVFLRIHRYSPVELDIPDGMIQDENTLTVTYTSDYRDTVPVAIREFKILEKEKAPFHITFVPDAAVSGKDIPILIETEADDMELCLKSDTLTAKTPLKFEKRGLHAIRLMQNGAGNGLQFSLTYGDTVKSGVIRKTVIRPDDNVVCGSGDLIYIDNSSEREMDTYFEWVMSNAVASLLTIRPAYRWGGGRTINEKVWKKFRELCTELGIDYVHMIDGRDLPGLGKNPHPDMLAGERFLGRQLHERDGQLFYWSMPPLSTKPFNESWIDMVHRLWRKSPLTTQLTYSPANVRMQRGKLSEMRCVDCKADMKEAHDLMLETMKKVRAGEPRHTGPSVMFKYFYDAGFEWTGAETMDSAMEPLLSFQRGAAKALGKKRTGVHHAVQWSTRPHDTQEKFRRYLLANYVSYMQGATDINTEEGLWFLEANYYYNNRFSKACKGHVAQQKKFYKFISSHSRSGEYYTPTALLHGRYDGWYGFGVSNLFGMPQFKPGEPENSWQVLHTFYPLCKITLKGMNVGGYFPENYGKPIGYYSGTPNGNADTIPIENGKFEDYKLLAFAGYNCAQKSDMDRLYSFVSGGGTLLAAMPHFSTITNRAEIEAGYVEIIDHPLTRAFVRNAPCYVKSEVSGRPLHVCINLAHDARVMEKTDDGLPLVMEYSLGKGRIVLFTASEYPGNEALMPKYQDVLGRLSREFLDREKIRVECDTDVEYVMYKQESGYMHVYITPVDWYNSPDTPRKAKLVVGGHEYELSLKFGSLVKIVSDGRVAAWPEDDDFEVLDVDGGIRVQGEGKGRVFIADGGKLQVKQFEITREPVIIV